MEERTATEKQKAVDLEEKQKAVVVAQQREREFELEKMKIQLEMQKLSQAPVTSQQLENPKLELNRIIPRFNSKEDEMGLYLTIFERQVKFLNIPEKTWTAYLIGSLPPDIAQLIAREDAQNYEKIKRKTPANIKEHFLDIWADLNDPLELAEKLHAYDNLRPGMKRSHQYHSSGPSRTVPRFPGYKTEGRNSIKCYGCGTPGVVKSKGPKCMRANEIETAVNCITLFNLNSNLYPTSVIVLKIFGEKIAVCVDTGASHTIAGEKMFKFLQEHDVTFTNKRISFMMADGFRQTIMALSTVVDMCIEGKVIPTKFLVLPEAKGNKTLLGLDFLNATGNVLDVQGGKWHSSGNPRKQYKFFKTLEDITAHSNFESMRVKIYLENRQEKSIYSWTERRHVSNQGGEHTPCIEHRFDTGDQPPIATYPYRMNPVKKQDCQKENFDRRRRKYYKSGDKVWVTIHPINRNNKSRKFMPKREGPYLILTLRSPVTYEIADPANLDQALGTYHVSALKDYQEPETERNTGFIASLRKRRRPKKELSPGSEPRRQRNQRGVCNTRFNTKTEM
ncbi:retrovirus-related Pol polyprotein from transposon 297 [Trichonephila clavipes]|nr:retrovirus-related Pol polyprotein from transposon 297 [Trichonephila clavipes]